MNPTAEQIEQLLLNGGISAECWDCTDGTVCAEIEWGDWKHEHGYADHLVSSKYPTVKIETDVTEEDGSDCYSAVHKYTF